jgi:hypothetical protein
MFKGFVFGICVTCNNGSSISLLENFRRTHDPGNGGDGRRRGHDNGPTTTHGDDDDVRGGVTMDDDGRRPAAR